MGATKVYYTAPKHRISGPFPFLRVLCALGDLCVKSPIHLSLTSNFI